MQVREDERVEIADIERDAGGGARLAEDLANGMRAIDEQPLPLGLQREAGGVVARRKGVADSKGEEAKRDSCAKHLNHAATLPAPPGDVGVSVLAMLVLYAVG